MAWSVAAVLLGLHLDVAAQAAFATTEPAGTDLRAYAGARGDGLVLLMRHALAPGVGDPADFQLGQCRTQRLLNDAGRAQARRAGEQLRAQGLVVRAVWHSQWCRTEETARLAFPGLAIQPRPAFNSFFGEPAEGAEQTARARAELATWRGPGLLLVVTHQVNITALTGVVPASGELLLVRPLADGTLQLLGRGSP